MSVRIEHWGDEPNHELKDGTPLWRYMKLSTFLLLLEGKAFFPSVATLRRDDPLECICDEDTIWLQNELNSDPDRYQKLCAWLDRWLKKHGVGDVRSRPLYHYEEHYIDLLRQLRAVWCWHDSGTESAAMWSLYAKAGVAVKTDVASLEAALPVSQDFLITRVRYVTRDPENPSWWTGWDRLNDPKLVLRPFLIKSAEYAHENEVRVVAFCQPRTPGWLIKDVDVQKLIKEVVVSPSVPHEEFLAIERMLKTRIDVPMRQSALLGHLIEEQQIHAIAAGYFSNKPGPEVPILLREL